MPLSSTTIECERIAAVLRADVVQPLRYLAERGVPCDWLEAAIGAPAQRRRQAIGLILIVVKPLSLLAGIAFGIRMQFVAAHLHHPPPLGDDLDSAVDVAEITGSLPPSIRRLLHFAHRHTPSEVALPARCSIKNHQRSAH